VTDLSTIARPFGRTGVNGTPVVRLRCLACEVAWTGAPDSDCWVCEQPGLALNRMVLRHEHHTTDALEEFDLLR
jgi:hypothetical protein